MRPVSEFQRILDETLNKTKEQPTFTSRPSEDTDLFSKLQFGDEILKVRFFNEKKRPYKKQEAKPNSEPRPEPKPAQSPPPPRPRVKRKLTFDQIKAVKVFTKFGELEIGDCSTIDEIKTAYRRLARKFHPDAAKKSGEEFKLISLAYKKLIS